MPIVTVLSLFSEFKPIDEEVLELKLEKELLYQQFASVESVAEAPVPDMRVSTELPRFDEQTGSMDPKLASLSLIQNKIGSTDT